LKRETMQRVATPTAILVAVAEPLATACADALAGKGLKVLRAGHVAAASERIPVTMPQLVVIPSTMHRDDRETLADRAIAVGAELLELAPDAGGESLAALLKDAANMALIRSLRRG